jgi:outer membrane biosynthesis protein TonB
MRHLLLITTLLFAGTAHAADAPKPVEHLYQARAHVTPAGTVEAVEPQEGMQPQVAALVTQAVQATTFTPATVNGEAAASKTTVWVKLRFEGVAGDPTGTQLTARVVDVSQRNPYLLPGPYPRAALEGDVSAKVWLEVATRPDGSVDPANTRVAQADFRASNGRKIERHRGATEIRKAALATAAAWKLFPEEVAGVARPTRLLVPLTYCIGRSSRAGECHDFDAGPAEAPRVATEEAVELPRLAPSAPGA